MADPKTYTDEELEQLLEKRLGEERKALLANRDEALNEAKRAKAALKNYEGVDPDEFKRLKAAAEDAERKKAAAEGDFKSLEKQLVERHGKELEARDAKIGKLTKALERRLVDARITEALAKHEAEPSMLPLLKLEGRRYVRVRETEDDYEEFVADERGNPLVADGKGTPMTVDDLVEQTLKTQYPAAFRGTGSSGGGASRSNGGAGGARVVAAGDTSAFIANLEGIATGKVEVR